MQKFLLFPPKALMLLIVLQSAAVCSLNGCTSVMPPAEQTQISEVNHPPEPGTFELHQAMETPGLTPRDVMVWLPPAYHLDTISKYNVLYMHDGQNVFDPQKSYAGVSWRAHLICDSLMQLQIIEPLIIVAIDNTADRLEEYTPGEKGELYMAFVAEVLKPFIDNKYRTYPEKQKTITAGASAGGTISFMLAWHYNDVFSKAICMSPALKIVNSGYEIDLVQTVEKREGRPKDAFFYIDNGGKGMDEWLQPGIYQMLDAMREKGYRDGESFVWYHDPTADHNEEAWSSRFPYALKIIFGLP